MIQVLFFAKLREQLGTEKIQITHEHNIDLPCSMRDIFSLLKHEFPQQQDAINDNYLLCSVNQAMVMSDGLDEKNIEDDSEVALFPPVTGG